MEVWSLERNRRFMKNWVVMGEWSMYLRTIVRKCRHNKGISCPYIYRYIYVHICTHTRIHTETDTTSSFSLALPQGCWDLRKRRRWRNKIKIWYGMAYKMPMLCVVMTHWINTFRNTSRVEGSGGLLYAQCNVEEQKFSSSFCAQTSNFLQALEQCWNPEILTTVLNSLPKELQYAHSLFLALLGVLGCQQRAFSAGSAWAAGEPHD